MSGHQAWRLVALAAVAAATVHAANATATTIAPSIADARVNCDPFCNRLTITGTNGSERLAVERDEGKHRLRITNSNGPLNAGPRCEQVADRVASCHLRPGWDLDSILNDGTDALTLQVSLPTGDTRGGIGDDSLIGSSADDTGLIGGSGKDRLVGRAGRDRLYGDSGSDKIDAVDGERDRVIDCGRGSRDVAIVDHRDPAPTGCETVRRRHRP